jgi:hypothetical protein
MQPTDGDPRRAHRHCPFFCEENVWQLALELGPQGYLVALLSNAARQVPMWAQRAADAPDRAVLWDYHAILLRPGADAQVLDLDSTLPFPSPLDAYLAVAFAGHEQWPERLRPRFRVLDAAAYCRRLWSDRAHMRDPTGAWLQPPPTWPAPLPTRDPWPLLRLLDLEQSGPGRVLDLAGLVAAITTAR